MLFVSAHAASAYAFPAELEADYAMRRSRVLFERSLPIALMLAFASLALIAWDAHLGGDAWAKTALPRGLSAALILIAIAWLRRDGRPALITPALQLILLLAFGGQAWALALLPAGLVSGLPLLVAILFIAADLTPAPRQLLRFAAFAGAITAFAVFAAVPDPSTQLNIALMLALSIAAACVLSRLSDQSNRRAFLNEHYSHLEARIDSLTGLANRRAIEEHGVREISRARRSGHSLSVLLLDLDHFKDVNDTYGHDVGDLVLKTLAARCWRLLRRSDLVARWGGEEFCIILPETSAEQAKNLAERIRQSIAAEPVQLPGGVLHVTASFGVAGFTRQDRNAGSSDWPALFKAADRALYLAKQGGRNCVVLQPRIGGGSDDAPLSATSRRTNPVMTV